MASSLKKPVGEKKPSTGNYCPANAAVWLSWLSKSGAGGATKTSDFVRLLAKAKARSYPRLFRRPAQLAWTSRWLGLLSVATHRAFARTLLELPVDEAGADGADPFLEDVLHESRLVEAPLPSRLPLHAG